MCVTMANLYNIDAARYNNIVPLYSPKLHDFSLNLYFKICHDYNFVSYLIMWRVIRRAHYETTSR